MKKVYILAILSLFSQSSWAQIRDFQTTRLTSTAGTGIASALSTEAAVLNPSSAAFFNDSSIAYQSYSTSLRRENDLRKANNDDFDESRSQGFFMSDHSGPVKGGVAYLSQDENDYERKQIVAHGAAAIGKGSAMGFSYKYITDRLPSESKNRNRVHHQSTIGTMHVLSENSIIGMVLVDPTRTTPNEERLIGGFQHTLTEQFILIGDAGAQYTKAFSKKYLWRAALQLNVFDDFFIRVGRFHDNILQLKGTGWGASWIGPRLGVEFGMKFSEQFGKDFYVYEDETIVDTSLSAIIKF